MDPFSESEMEELEALLGLNEESKKDEKQTEEDSSGGLEDSDKSENESDATDSSEPEQNTTEGPPNPVKKSSRKKQTTTGMPTWVGYVAVGVVVAIIIAVGLGVGLKSSTDATPTTTPGPTTPGTTNPGTTPFKCSLQRQENKTKNDTSAFTYTQNSKEGAHIYYQRKSTYRWLDESGKELEKQPKAEENQPKEQQWNNSAVPVFVGETKKSALVLFQSAYTAVVNFSDGKTTADYLYNTKLTPPIQWKRKAVSMVSISNRTIVLFGSNESQKACTEEVKETPKFSEVRVLTLDNDGAVKYPALELQVPPNLQNVSSNKEFACVPLLNGKLRIIKETDDTPDIDPQVPGTITSVDVTPSGKIVVSNDKKEVFFGNTDGNKFTQIGTLPTDGATVVAGDDNNFFAASMFKLYYYDAGKNSWNAFEGNISGITQIHSFNRGYITIQTGSETTTYEVKCTGGN